MPKKYENSLKPSIRELQNAPIPSRSPKLKPPSKSQMMMEQLKASIEADKHKPKKDIKSKLSEIINVSLPKRNGSNENEGQFSLFNL